MARDADAGARRQLALQTGSLVAAFMVWVILSTLLPFIRQDIALSADEAALVTAVPVILGSVLRIPFGYWANLVGARVVFTASFVALLAPVLFLSGARTFADLVAGGVFLGIGGAVFSVGVTSLPKYYPKERQGFVNGVYGLGNAGTALTTFLAPVAAQAWGWQTAIRAYLVLMAAMAAANALAGDRAEPKVKTPLARQFAAVRRDVRLWCYALFYFVTFGAFVALTVFLPNFLATAFSLGGVEAGLWTTAFIVVAAGLRPLGGWLGDRFDCLVLLVGVFAGLAAGAVLLGLGAAGSLPSFLAGVFAVAVACGVGNGVVFKLVPTHFMAQAGLVNGIVAMMGGLGGFFPPLVLQAARTATGSYAAGFALFAAFCLACLFTACLLRKRGRRAASSGR